MSIKKQVKACVKKIIRIFPPVRNYFYGRILYRRYIRIDSSINFKQFLRIHSKQFYCCLEQKSKAEQISHLIQRVNIHPVKNENFFYSIDPYKTSENRERIYDNYTVDVALLVKSDLTTLCGMFRLENDNFRYGIRSIVTGLREYLSCCQSNEILARKYGKQFNAIESLFERPANSFFEALQRILFYNQFLWQTGHTLNGLGHLDWILEELYAHDISSGIITRENAKELLKDFFRVLHEYYWFKSANLMGDTGQIVILGGRDQSGKYHYNELTYLFIEISKELCLPDPKVLLRCTADMSQELLEMAVDCISTGIGAPLLSNDDVVIPAMISCGYEKKDACNYGTSACWEPLVPGMSFEPNNIGSLNFAIPFTRMANSDEFEDSQSIQEVISLYQRYLREYIYEILMPLTTKVFEMDPLLSLASISCMKRGKDITSGGAKYNNVGLTSVGLGSVVNSILNIDRLVFSENRFTLHQLNSERKRNYIGCDELVGDLKSFSSGFGSDSQAAVELSRYLIKIASIEFHKYNTPNGGMFKFGLSSPSYISGADVVPATFDGRRNGEPFGVHISSTLAVPTTELLSFAMKMDYSDNRINGNVIDFIVSPGTLYLNRQKYTALLRAGFSGGIFQLQMNVVDSKTLIAAKANPTLFPNLVVRVWGFSAYFNDLPEEYKDVLIYRAIESEKAA